MKRSAFVAIVNDVAEEERKILSESVSKVLKSADDDKTVLAKLLAEGFTQATDSSVRSAAKIIEKLGLVSLTDD